jgi:hypothetical protein
MKASVISVWLAILVFWTSSVLGAPLLDHDAELLDGKEWQALALITGFHAVHNKKAGFDARLLEADGSATVAQDPVALFVVVESGETPNVIVHSWRLPRGVARVRGFAATECGAKVRVDVDRITAEGEVRGTTPRTLRLCFLAADGRVQERLRVTETSR